MNEDYKVVVYLGTLAAFIVALLILTTSFTTNHKIETDRRNAAVCYSQTHDIVCSAIIDSTHDYKGTTNAH